MEITHDKLEISRSKIAELKAELEVERNARKKAESSTKKMGRELVEEKKWREASERAWVATKEEMNRMKKEMEDERKMLRMAEVLREERVQMKLAEAKLVLEEKLLELELTYNSNSKQQHMDIITSMKINAPIMCHTAESCSSKTAANNSCCSSSSTTSNPHIRRGIKGFVEFPRAVGATSSWTSNYYKRIGIIKK